jgi:transposase
VTRSSASHADENNHCDRRPRTSGSCLNRWLSIDEIESGDRPGVTKADAAETRELKKRNKILEEENLILRRAAAFFAKEMLPK